MRFNSQKNASSVCGLVTCTYDRSPVVYTGSSDQRIRYWDLLSRGNCSMVIPANRDSVSSPDFSYE